jgi:hypothetical protein
MKGVEVDRDRAGRFERVGCTGKGGVGQEGHSELSLSR